MPPRPLCTVKALGLLTVTSPAEASVMEGHPGEGDTWAESQIVAAGGGQMHHAALNPRIVPEGPLSCGRRNRFRGQSQNRNTWETQSGFRLRTRCSEQSTDRLCSTEWSGEGKH